MLQNGGQSILDTTTATKAVTALPTTASYMVQLDALRALAVLAVVFHHYIRGGWSWGANAGVKLFFAISGFLITGILLKARESVSAGHSTTIGALGRFYARRFLRIFPLYYFVIAVAFVIDLEPARRLIGWLLSYTLNIYMAHNGWFEANFAHFWSLAVEEQFYICWPWLVLFLPRKWLMPAIVAIISVGPLYRLSYSLSGYQNMTGLSTYISTPTSLDNLGFGALLALLVQRYGPEHVLWMRLKRFVFPLAVVASLAILRWGSLDVPTILYGPLQAIVFCCLIYCTSRGIGGPLGRMMEYKPVVYVGKISYGLYVYHPLIPGLVAWLLLKGAKASHPETLLVSALATVITVTVASLSWHLFEKPINDLKRHF